MSHIGVVLESKTVPAKKEETKEVKEEKKEEPNKK
jgi:hypothetical protein